ncbi:type VI secretion system accessory protein TagJ [Pontivivens ytuae]
MGEPISRSTGSMTAAQLLKDGDLDGALAALQDHVRKAPDDPKARVFLFQLLCILGDWGRAVAQLRTCAKLDPTATPMAQTYREAIICELYREKVFSGAGTPPILGEPEDWTTWLVEALAMETAGNRASAEELRAHAFDAAPAMPGILNGTPFEWIADADPRMGPVLEIILNGRYFWAPFPAIRRLTLEPPADLRDHVWMPATVIWADGGGDVVLIPTRYPGAGGEAQHRLARATDWLTEGEHVTAGLGQRLLATDTTDCALMDLRELVIGGEAQDG